MFTNQVHGDTVRTVDASNCGEGLLRPAPEPCDALITNVPGVTLTVLSADCVPVLLVDPIRKVAGAVHAGWRGTASGIVKKTVEAMTACYGAKPCDLICAIGPSIGACCFETDPDVPEALRETLGASASPHVIPVSPGRFRIDLKAVNALWLSRCGVENVSISSECTVCRPERYFSHRRQGKRRGSMASVIQIIDNN